ncbi:MAG: NADH-ubiquinone oxidoreductase-F iron-sulfur binding region domain-containing protein [Planctomycetota bacterium]
MSHSSDDDLIAAWRDEPAPLLPLLHAFHDRDGFLSDETLRAVSKGLRIPLAELHGTVTFYHHFARHPPGQSAPRVCTGPVCKLRGADALLATLEKDGATAMPCSGRCDDPIPVLFGHETRVGLAADALEARPSALPVPNPGGLAECVFDGIREPGRATLEGYVASGGYAGLDAALALAPDAIRAVVTESGLAGRGGAAFPTGRKWDAVATAEGGPKTIVCNADEGEPGCFKDRALMDWDPHALIEGMIIAALATGAERGFIYLRYEYPETEAILERAIAEARASGRLGADVGGSGRRFELHLRRGAGAYICGEETSLLNSLEGKHPFPRNRPPFPVTHGFEDRPTAVNNVETLASVPRILARGAAWYRGLGLRGNAGTKVISLSGDVRRPGNYEVPIGFPLATLLNDWAGGPLEGRSFRAVTMAGVSGGFIAGEAMETLTLDDACIRPLGSFLGAGGIIVYDDSRDMVAATHEIMHFFAHESCGKCFPCRIGTQRMTERLAGTAGPGAEDPWRQEVADLSEVMKATSACGLGQAAPLAVESLLRYFPEQVAEHIRGSQA